MIVPACSCMYYPKNISHFFIIAVSGLNSKFCYYLSAVGAYLNSMQKIRLETKK
jgi:hypothetical protein